MPNIAIKNKTNWLVGCGLTLFLGMGAVGLAWLGLEMDRSASRFPNAELVSRQSNYTSFPYRYRWVDAYLITDADFRTVYTWYSLQFGTGPERQANGRCILLESGQSNFLLERYNVITLCDNPQIGTRAYVQRLTSWR